MTKENEVSLEVITSNIQKYYPDADVEKVKRAFIFAEKAHLGQKRSSGDPYITHPMQVAQILTDLKLDVNSIIAGLLHDTVEDTSVSLEDVNREFGKDIADLVDGVTKLSKITFRTSEERQAENFRKMIIAMARDIRIILIKLADRLTNMRTLNYLPEYKQKIKAQETLDIYAPIANRLGMSWIKVELEDLALRYLHPDVYYKLAQKVSKTKKEREKYIDSVCDLLREKLKDYDIEANIVGRAKHFLSIYKKMEQRKIEYEQVHDVIAFRILVDNITECYKALGVIHSLYKPVPGRIKDYIAMPKTNNYQSLHTTVIGPYGDRIEIQIRTHEMNSVAERGIAAHWQYKEGKFDDREQKNIEWVKRLYQWQKDLADPNEFLETVKLDLFEEDIFVFTPKGEVKQLQNAATPLDFAYAIHTEIGHICIGAKINGKIVPLKHKLKSGDTVEILTSPTQTPSKDWLKVVKSSKAKAKIRAYIKSQERSRAVELGEELLEKSVKPFGMTFAKLEKSGALMKAAQALGLKNMEELKLALGYGRRTKDEVLKEVIPKEQLENYLAKEKAEEDESFLKKVFKAARKRSEAKNAITVANLDDVLIRFAKCCNPLPGDSIIGFITRGRGVTIHTANCTKALDTDPERKVEVNWNIQNKGRTHHHVKLRILCTDEPGLLAMMSQTISTSGVNIASANIRTTKDKKAICLFDLEVTDTDQLSRIMNQLEAKKGVIAVERTRS